MLDLLLVELLIALGLAELIGVPSSCASPGTNDTQKLIRDVDFTNVDETCALKEFLLHMRTRGEFRRRDFCAAAGVFGESGWDEYRIESYTPPATEDPPAGSQHGELGINSSEDVRMDDAVEDAAAKRKAGARGPNERGFPSDIVFLGALDCSEQSRCGDVCQNNVAAAGAREIEAGPAAP